MMWRGPREIHRERCEAARAYYDAPDGNSSAFLRSFDEPLAGSQEEHPHARLLLIYCKIFEPLGVSRITLQQDYQRIWADIKKFLVRLHSTKEGADAPFTDEDGVPRSAASKRSRFGLPSR